MINLTIGAQWTKPDGHVINLDHKLFDILQAVDQSGSLSLASQRLAISYRTLWSQVQHYNQLLENDIVKTQGRAGASLTPFGHQIRWMFEQAKVRIQPEAEIAAEQLNAEWLEKGHNKPWISFALSNDPLLQQMIRGSGMYNYLQTSLRWLGSIPALSAMHRGEVKVAGCNLPRGDTSAGSVYGIMRKWLRGENLFVLPMFQREIGWIHRRRRRLAPTLREVAQGAALLVNQGASTTSHHHLLSLITREGYKPDQLPGFYHQENTHMAVACSLGAGHGDVALGIRTAADCYQLEFDPVCWEEYFMVFNKYELGTLAIQAMQRWVASDGYSALIDSRPGYRRTRHNNAVSLEDFLCQFADDEHVVNVPPYLVTK